MTSKKPKNANSRGKTNESPRAGDSGVYFLSISLENVRCFSEKQTLDLSDGEGKPAQWTILLGDNGTGKTTVLQAIALLAEIPDNFRRPFKISNEDGGSPIRQLPRLAWFAEKKQGFYRREDSPVKLTASVGKKHSRSLCRLRPGIKDFRLRP